MILSPALLLLLTSCRTTVPAGDDSSMTFEQVTSPEDSVGPGFMKSSSENVVGVGCAWDAGDLADGAAGDLLAVRWGEIDGLSAGGKTWHDADSLRAWLRSASGDDAAAAALAISVAMNDVGLFGMYASVGDAQLIDGVEAGIPARSLRDPGSVRQILGAFHGCDAGMYLDEVQDLDGDGVPATLDCDDADATVGTSLYASGFDANDGFLNAPAHHQESWTWDGDSVYAAGGGQQTLLGQAQTWSDYQVRTTIRSAGTEVDCGFDCAESCGEYVPEDGCYSDWQALGLGILTMSITANGVATFHNSGAYDVCFDGYLMWDEPSSQGMTIGREVVEDDTYRVPAGGDLHVYYGSWTTDNHAYDPFFGLPPMWCYQAGSLLMPGTTYSSIGSLLPDALQNIIGGTIDEDGDGVEDHSDWAGSYGVQAQYDVWSYQQSHAAAVVGKLASSQDDGTVLVTLTAQNRGAVSTAAALTDTLPEHWSVVSCSQSPAVTDNADGTTTLDWTLSLDGCQSECSVVDEQVITCNIAYDLPTDLDIVELPAASIAYDAGDGPATSWSMPAAAFDYDVDGDGNVTCGQTDRWRSGLLARATADADQTEGFHGYRCALASNASDDTCHVPGQFLQIAEFEDAPEDGVSSECTHDCEEDHTFDQLARVDFADGYDHEGGDSATLSFRVFEGELSCTATDASGNVIASAHATDPTFGDGTTGLSTLNDFADYDDLQVCEVYGI
jgi:hypothetical protein